MFVDSKFHVKTEVFEKCDDNHRTKTMFLKTHMFETHFGRLIKQHRKTKLPVALLSAIFGLFRGKYKY